MKSFIWKNCTCYFNSLTFTLLLTMTLSQGLQAAEPISITWFNTQIHFLNMIGKAMQNSIDCLPELYLMINQGSKDYHNKCAIELPQKAYKETMAIIPDSTSLYTWNQEIWDLLREIENEKAIILENVHSPKVFSKEQLLERLDILIQMYRTYKELHEKIAVEISTLELLDQSVNELYEAEVHMRKFFALEKDFMDRWKYHILDTQEVFFPLDYLSGSLLESRNLYEASQVEKQLPYVPNNYYQQFLKAVRKLIDIKSKAINTFGFDQKQPRELSNQLYRELVIYYNEELIPVFYNYVTACQSLNYYTTYEAMYIPSFQLHDLAPNRFMVKKNIAFSRSIPSNSISSSQNPQTVYRALVKQYNFLNSAMEAYNLFQQRMYSGSAYNRSSMSYGLVQSDYEAAKNVHPNFKKDTQNLIRKFINQLWQYQNALGNIDKQIKKEGLSEIEKQELEERSYETFFNIKQEQDRLEKVLKEVYTNLALYDDSSSELEANKLLTNILTKSHKLLSISPKYEKYWDLLEDVEFELDYLKSWIDKHQRFSIDHDLNKVIAEIHHFMLTAQGNASNSPPIVLRSAYNQLIKAYNLYIMQAQLLVSPHTYVPLYE